MKLHRNIQLLIWFNFFIEFRLYAPIAILYFAQISGSYALGMSVFSIATLAASVFEIPTGIFSDQIGRKYTVIAGSIASVVSVTMYAVGGSYFALVTGAIFEGLARAFFSGNNDALLYDTLAESGNESAFQEFLGKVSSSYQVALACAAILGGIVAVHSFAAAMWLSVVPQILCVLIGLRFIEPHTHKAVSSNPYVHLRAAFLNTIRNRRLRALSAASIVGNALSESNWLFQSAFIVLLWPTWALGLVQMLANVGAAVSFYFSGKIIRQHGEFRILTVNIFYSRVVSIIALLMPGVFSPLLLTTPSLLYGMSTIAVGGLMQREFSDEQRATMGSLNSFAGSIAFAICSYLLGLLADHVGVSTALLVTSLLGFSTWRLYKRAFKNVPKHSPVLLREV
jgi:MFS family permease